jgi:hypothetical protein
VDDGLATGSSMRAAVEAVRRLRPAAIVVAVPAAPESTCRELNALADNVVCATTPSPFFAVGESYWDFTQTTDEEVRDLLRAAPGSRAAAGGGPGPTEVAAIRAEAVPVAEGAPADDVLFDLVGDAHFVLIGEASHGTGEFYTARAQMTRRLIEERGFCAVAAEGDWPDAYRVNRYVRGRGEDATAEEALRGFERFPTWMWRNAAVLDFIGWLRGHNDWSSLDGRAKAGFYGLDLYSRRRRGMAPRHRRCSFSGMRGRRGTDRRGANGTGQVALGVAEGLETRNGQETAPLALKDRATGCDVGSTRPRARGSRCPCAAGT